VTFTDSHAHLADARFDADRDAVLERARAAGVERILTIAEATQPAECDKTLELAELHPFLWVAAGVHPHEARHATDKTLDALEELLRSPRALAWGEIGLDYHYDHSPRDVQQAVFREQLQRARARRLPVVIHCREAWNDCLRILGEEWATAGQGGILHCFSSTADVARQALEWGFLISFAGNVTFPRAENLREAAQAVPLDRLLIETDCPYLAPQAVRGKRNEPANVRLGVKWIAKLKGLAEEAAAEAVFGNYRRLFRETVLSR